MPRVSLIMPVFNAGKFLKESMESILGQTYTDFEFIIINDGSTDDSEDIIHGYTDPRVKYSRHATNRGVVETLNEGLSLANGDYVARMDADDIALPQRLHEQVKFMDDHPYVGVAGSWVAYIGDRTGVIKMPAGHEDVVWAMLFGSPFFHPSVMMRRTLFSTSGVIYPTGFPHAEDYALWSKLLGVTRFANLPMVLLRYRASSQSVSSKFQDIQQEINDRISRNVHEYLLKRSLTDREWGNLQMNSKRPLEVTVTERTYLELLRQTPFMDKILFDKNLKIRIKQLILHRTLQGRSFFWLLKKSLQDITFLKYFAISLFRRSK